MTRIAALYDVHGNLPALEAVLAEVDDDKMILVGGDAVLGPMPKETLALLRERDATFIRGNCDREVAAPGEGEELWTRRARWVHEQLDEKELAFLRDLPHPLALEVDGLGEVLFCHGSPRSDEEILTAITPPKRLDPILDGVTQDVVVCGHTHAQFDRLVGDRRLVNAGSVGMAYEGEPGIAAWALIGPTVELRRTPYDVEAAAAQVLETGFPDAEELVNEALLHPPSAEEVTAGGKFGVRIPPDDPAAWRRALARIFAGGLEDHVAEAAAHARSRFAWSRILDDVGTAIGLEPVSPERVPSFATPTPGR